jgi:16S rRNA (guanine527-N7)-methyltransferase
VSDPRFRDRLFARGRRVGLAIPAHVVDPLAQYLRLLTRWNSRINLTALSLEPATDETFDRLLIEPLVVASLMKPPALEPPATWYDLGSGGGSPAIPIKVAHPRARLTMVESRSRKAAFLREVIRTLALSDAVVENRRFEDVSSEVSHQGIAELVTVRALRADATLFGAVRSMLSQSGRAFLIHSAAGDIALPSGLSLERTVTLDPNVSKLMIIQLNQTPTDVPRGTQSG